MKTVWKIVLCSLAAVLLIGLLVWALVFDFTVPVLHFGDDFDDSGYTVMDVSGEAVISEKIKALDIQWSSGSVRICAYDGNEIILRETAQDNEASRLRYRVENGKLNVRERKRSLLSTHGKSLEILLPTKIATALSSVDLDVASAEITMEALTAEKLEIDTASGDVTATVCSFTEVDYDGASSECRMENCTIGEFEMDTASGDAVLSGSISEISFDAASGNLTVTTSVAPKKIDISTASGDADLTIPAAAAFTLEYDAISKDCNISDFVGSISADRFICGSGSAKYDFDTASGKLALHAGE